MRLREEPALAVWRPLDDAQIAELAVSIEGIQQSEWEEAAVAKLGNRQPLEAGLAGIGRGGITVIADELAVEEELDLVKVGWYRTRLRTAATFADEPQLSRADDGPGLFGDLAYYGIGQRFPMPLPAARKSVEVPLLVAVANDEQLAVALDNGSGGGENDGRHWG